MEALDDILNDEDPYSIKMNSFVWWKGSNLAALEAYGVTNLTQLKNYLELQRERINYLAREFAEPLVSILEEINKEGMPGNLPLVTKWEGILDSLNGYTKKAPGNGLRELETYIMNPLNEVTLATCSKYANTVNMLSVSQDYFVDILVNLQELLHKQCISLSGVVSTDNYTQLAEFFNANLAGKFPFVSKSDESAPEADPETLRAFFDLMDSQGGNIKATLKEAKNLGPAGQSALTFIEKMEKVRSFFGGYLSTNSTLLSPAFGLDVTFRVNKDREKRANEILDWEINTQDATITMRSPSKKGYWTSGAPISVTFRWAQNSPLQPQSSVNLENYQVQGENAFFSYQGQWGLVRLLRQHQATPSDFDNLNDQQPITLRFDIPLTNTMTDTSQGQHKATVFVRLQVSPVEKSQDQNPTKSGSKSLSSKSDTSPQHFSVAEKKGLKTGAPVTLPEFPSRAPLFTLTGGKEQCQ